MKNVNRKNLKLQTRNCLDRFTKQLKRKKEKMVSKHLKLKVWGK